MANLPLCKIIKMVELGGCLVTSDSLLLLAARSLSCPRNRTKEEGEEPLFGWLGRKFWGRNSHENKEGRASPDSEKSHLGTHTVVVGESLIRKRREGES